MAPTALITGGSQGIGRETALLFASKGYNIAIAARNADRLEAAANEIRRQGVEVLAHPADTRDFGQVRSLVEKVQSQFGAIDVLINNAGIYCSGPTEAFSLDDWHTILDTNLWGYIHTIHAVLPAMVERGKGTIINLSSIGGKVPVPYLTVYCTSKFAVAGLTESLHSELEPKGIHVGGIYPNLIKSDFMERAVFRGKDLEDANARREQLNQVLAAPIVEKPTDVAKAVWEAVDQRKKEVIVGSANVSIASHRLIPGAMQALFRRTFKLQDSWK